MFLFIIVKERMKIIEEKNRKEREEIEIIIKIIGMLAILWFGGYRVIEGDLSYGTIVSFMLYSRSYSQSVQDFGDAYTSIVVASGIAEVLFKLFDYKPKMLEFNIDGISPKVIGAIEFRKVSFSYPTKPEVMHLPFTCLRAKKQLFFRPVTGFHLG